MRRVEITRNRDEFMINISFDSKNKFLKTFKFRRKIERFEA